MRKAQAAMEFLMTYGWAILVVLVAISALAYFGVLSPEKFLPEKCVISSGSGLFCDDYSATQGGIILKLKNILDDSVTINTNAISISFDNGGSQCTGPILVGQTIASDNVSVFNMSNGANCITKLMGNPGKKVKGDIAITYQKTGGLQKTTSGQIVTTVR